MAGLTVVPDKVVMLVFPHIMQHQHMRVLIMIFLKILQIKIMQIGHVVTLLTVLSVSQIMRMALVVVVVLHVIFGQVKWVLCMIQI